MLLIVGIARVARCAAVLACVVATLPACSSSLQSDSVPVRTFIDEHSAESPIDLLVIVDDSSGISPFAETLAAGFSDFAHVFERMVDGLPSMHAAFVPATLSAGGCVGQGARGASCGLAEPFAAVDGCGASPNFPGTLASAFVCLGDFGTGGCGAPTPLAALRRALGGDTGQGPLVGPRAFLRPEAALAIVIVATADDGSTRDGLAVPVQEYADFVKSLKTDPLNRVFVSVIAPPPIEGTPRLVDFVQAFGRTSVVYPLAVGQGLAQALAELVTTSGVLVGPTCAAGIRDFSPDVPGLQPDCTADDQSSFVDGTTLRSVHASIPSCDVASAPCWRLSRPPGTNCPADAWALTIDRGSDWCPQFAARTVVSCRGCSDPTDRACAGP